MSRSLKAALWATLLAVPLAAQAADPHPVKVAVLTDMSSAYTDSVGKGSLVAAELAIDDIGGNLLGKPVDFVFADFQLKPDVGMQIARKWLEQENVDMIVDIPNSALALALQPVVGQMNKVMMTNAQSSDITGKNCTDTSAQYAQDTYALPNVLARALTTRGAKDWFFITVDYALGDSMQRDASGIIEKMGGKVIGSVRHPLGTNDYASYLLQAQSSGAKVVAFANVGTDLAKSLAQAYEFGIDKQQQLAAFSLEVTDLKSIGLDKAHGLYTSMLFYWDQNDKTRAFSERFAARMNGRVPNQAQSSIYVATLQYLKAVRAAGSQLDGRAVMAKMREIPLEDMTSEKAWVREDGRFMRDWHLMQVKSPAESKGGWDFLKLEDRVAAIDAFRSAADSACPLLKK